LSFTYEYFFTRQISFCIGIDGYARKKVGQYNDLIGIFNYFDEGDFAFDPAYESQFPTDTVFFITHVFNVSITPVQVSLKLAPMGRRGKFIPYIGGGVGIYFWNVRLQGDIVDFEDVWTYDDTSTTPTTQVDIFAVQGADLREESKIGFGAHAFGGITVPVGKRLGVDAEFKYNFAKGNLKDAFQDFPAFDLSGYQISLGISYWF
jgi:hypothetical protein